jgi:hypothetical protein
MHPSKTVLASSDTESPATSYDSSGIRFNNNALWLTKRNNRLCSRQQGLTYIPTVDELLTPIIFDDSPQHVESENTAITRVTL